MPDYLSRDDAAKYLSVSLRTIDRLMMSGRLPFTKMGGRTLFRREHLMALPVDMTADSAELPPFVRRRPSRAAEAA
jgi:excisionase family DNA binding protein